MKVSTPFYTFLTAAFSTDQLESFPLGVSQSPCPLRPLLRVSSLVYASLTG
jgi:hypothetical protein